VTAVPSELFRGAVLWCPLSHAGRGVYIINSGIFDSSGYPEVMQMQVDPLPVSLAEQKVFRLQIPVIDAFPINEVERDYHICDESEDLILGEGDLLPFLKVFPEISLWEIVKHDTAFLILI